MFGKSTKHHSKIIIKRRNYCTSVVEKRAVEEVVAVVNLGEEAAVVWYQVVS